MHDDFAARLVFTLAIVALVCVLLVVARRRDE